MTSSPLTAYRASFLPALEDALREVVTPWQAHPAALLFDMVEHHFGWRDAAAKKGKRVRPFLLLLVHEASGGQWQQALPAAVAVELIHNFSLIHDDIQDRSETRRGRPTVWARWGKAQAINAGDALFAQAFAVMAPLQEAFGPQRALEAMRVLAQACVALVQGQVLDLSFETRSAVTVEEYMTMIRGKTGALLAAAAEVGALLAGAEAQRREAFQRFGETLGLAFQVWDDYLGIWGDPAKTGKSAADDLVAGKKTLPVLYGLQQPESAFARRWREGPITPDEAPQVARDLAATGARTFVREQAARLTREALAALDAAQPLPRPGEALKALAQELLGRAM